MKRDCLHSNQFSYSRGLEFERWELFVYEGRTLTIPRLPSAGFKMAKSGVWGRLDIKNPPTAVWGDLRVQVALPDLVRLAKKGRRSLSADRAADPKTGNPRKYPNLSSAH